MCNILYKNMSASKEITKEILNDTDFEFSKHFCYKSALGHGSFGYVVLAVSKSTLETMAVKVSHS